MKLFQKISLGAAAFLTSAVVFAEDAAQPSALPKQAEEALGQLSGTVTAFVDAAWPIVVLMVVASIGIKLFKKFASKAT